MFLILVSILSGLIPAAAEGTPATPLAADFHEEFQLDEIFQEPRDSADFEPEFATLISAESPLLERLPVPDALFLDELPTPTEPLPTLARKQRSPGEKKDPFQARAGWMPARPIDDQPADWELRTAELQFGVPIYHDSNGIWLGLSGIRRLDITTAAVLPDSGLPVPSQLWDIQAGVMHTRELSGGRQAGGMLRIGSPSDQPFGAVRDLTVSFLGFYNIPHGDRDAWNFSLFYSPTGQIIFPIPGVAYSWRPNDQFKVNLGIPFSLEYHPTDSLEITANYLPINQVQLLARQTLSESLCLYGGYRTVNETFLLADRENDRERTYLFDQRILLGLQQELPRGWNLDLSVAHVFDRQFFQAEKFSGTRRDELMIESGLAGTLQLSWTR